MILRWKPIRRPRPLCSTLTHHSRVHFDSPVFLSSASVRGRLRLQVASTKTTPTLPSDAPVEDVYFPEDDVEDLEQYRPGGYHPTLIDDTFQDGRYTVVHKLGYGGYSTIWLARDHQENRYVSLKIKVSELFSPSRENQILRLLGDHDSKEEGSRFIPRLMDEFSFVGPNGNHSCLIGQPAGLNISVSKDISPNWKFPVESARSIAAQLAMGLLYIHKQGVCHGGSCFPPSRLPILFDGAWISWHDLSILNSLLDLHLRNFLLRMPSIDHLAREELYERYRKPFPVPVRRLDGKDPQPQAPPHAIYPMSVQMPADKVMDPEIFISDYGTSFVVSQEPNPTLHTPALYLPPEDFFSEPVTLAADVWTLGVSLYEVLGERPLFETFAWDRDDIIAEMVSTLGILPSRWWDKWANRGEFFNPDGSWIPANQLRRITTPIFRPLHQRMWDMGRGETPGDCEWDVDGGEMRALEELLMGMLAFEPSQRLTAEEVMASEYMTKWAMPAWQRRTKRISRKP
ncbi:protein kinase domain-containing protein [Diaporthe helianthi]|uniref:non-specific serine/threonine protein kinase n=1 Tax=Diaporthe helianthi TaxID=158607 RepID=A0A2P5I4J0_DIAHE|nr:protein kinase domain-containing protein [Diaporthe helianthi]